jgi:hypothetical protein
MGTRSARGEMVNFEFLAIKQQLASQPVPASVKDRKTAIEEREGTKPIPAVVDNDMLQVAQEAAIVSAAEEPPVVKTAPKRK